MHHQLALVRAAEFAASIDRLVLGVRHETRAVIPRSLALPATVIAWGDVNIILTRHSALTSSFPVVRDNDHLAVLGKRQSPPRAAPPPRPQNRSTPLAPDALAGLLPVRPAVAGPRAEAPLTTHEQPLATPHTRWPGMTPETLRKWVRRAEVDGGARPGPTTEEQTRLRELERENRELRRANEILKAASVNSSGQCNTIRKMTEVCSREIGPTGNVGCEAELLWQLWGDGQSFSEISRAIGHPPGSIFTVIAQTGGYVPAPRRRRAGSLTLAEREEISRGLARGDSLRHNARRLVVAGRRTDHPCQISGRRTDGETREEQYERLRSAVDPASPLEGPWDGRQNLMRPTDTHDASLLALAC